MVDGELITVQHLPEKVIYDSAANHDDMLVPEGGIDLEDELTRIEIAYLQPSTRVDPCFAYIDENAGVR
jgi:hypothetical protein